VLLPNSMSSDWKPWDGVESSAVRSLHQVLRREDVMGVLAIRLRQAETQSVNG
jgi:hypothetical protein